MPMKPAFDEVLYLDDDRQTVSAAGPYDVQDGDTDAYFWIRISQRRGGVEVEAIATHEQEEEEIKDELNRAALALRDAIATAVGSSLPAAGAKMPAKAREKATAAAQAAAEAAVRESGPRWAKDAEVKDGKKFRAGRAKAEGWLLTKTGPDDHGRDVFWTSDVTLAAKDQTKPPSQ
jgi:hypothetical protein